MNEITMKTKKSEKINSQHIFARFTREINSEWRLDPKGPVQSEHSVKKVLRCAPHHFVKKKNHEEYNLQRTTSTSKREELKKRTSRVFASGLYVDQSKLDVKLSRRYWVTDRLPSTSSQS